MGKGVSRTEYHDMGRRSQGGPRAYSAERDPRQRQIGDYGGGNDTSTDAGRDINLPPWAVRKLAEMLIPLVTHAAAVLYPPLTPLISAAYALYAIYQQKENIAEVAKKISDDDMEGLARMAAKEIAKKGVEVVADSIASDLADKSSERLEEAGLFKEMPEAEEYYREFVKDKVSELIDESGEKFVDRL